MAKKHLKDSLAEYMIQKIAAQAEKESRKLLKHISAIYRVDAAGNTGHRAPTSLVAKIK